MNDPQKPILDQKVVPEKSGKGWIWILLILIILGLLAWWFFGHRDNKNAEAQPAQQAAMAPAAMTDNAASLPTTTQVAQQQNSMTPVDSFASSAASTDNDNMLAQLQAYYANSSMNKSEDYNLTAIDFGSQSPAPKVNDQNAVTQLAALLNQHPNSKIVLHGYTDSTGPERINDPLSTQRAQAVKDLLVKENVAANRISVSGESDKDPIATNDNAQGRDINRRVTLHVTGK